MHKTIRKAIYFVTFIIIFNNTNVTFANTSGYAPNNINTDSVRRIQIILDPDVPAFLLNLSCIQDDATTNMFLKEYKDMIGQYEGGPIKILKYLLSNKGLVLKNYFCNRNEDETAEEQYLNTIINDAIDQAIEIVANRFKNRLKKDENSQLLHIDRVGKERIIADFYVKNQNTDFRKLTQGTADVRINVLETIETSKSTLNKINTKFTEINLDLFNMELSNKYGYLILPYDNYEKIQRVISNEKIKSILQNNIILNFGYNRIKEQGKEYKALFVLNKENEIKGNNIQNIEDINDNKTLLKIVLNSEGASKFKTMTSTNKNKKYSLIIDNVVYSINDIDETISNGTIKIGKLDNDETENIFSTVLKSGTLPIKLRIIQEMMLVAPDYYSR